MLAYIYICVYMPYMECMGNGVESGVEQYIAVSDFHGLLVVFFGQPPGPPRSK